MGSTPRWSHHHYGHPQQVFPQDQHARSPIPVLDHRSRYHPRRSNPRPRRYANRPSDGSQHGIHDKVLPTRHPTFRLAEDQGRTHRNPLHQVNVSTSTIMRCKTVYCFASLFLLQKLNYFIRHYNICNKYERKQNEVRHIDEPR